MNRRLLVVGCVSCLFVGALSAQQPPQPLGGGGSAAGGVPPASALPGAGVGGGPMSPGGGAPTGMGMPGMGSAASVEKDVKAMTLEELLAKALRDNPDIRVAETKVREAEAELNRTRLQMMEKVTKLHAEIAISRQMIVAAEDLLAMSLKGASTAREQVEGRLVLAKTKLELAKMEPELAYLVGKQAAAKSPGASMGSGTSIYVPALGPDFGRGPMPLAFNFEYPATRKLPVTVTDKIRKALDTEVTLRQSEMTLHDAVSLLSDKMQGMNVHISDKKLMETKINLYLLQPVALGAVFQYFEDELNCKCVVREYGIVIAPRERTPPGGQSLLDVWKERATSKSDTPKTK